MRLGRSISVTGRVLLNAGVELHPRYIQPLIRHGIAAVYVIDDLAPDVTPADVIDPQTRESVKRDLQAITSGLGPLFEQATRRGARQVSVQLDTERLVKSVEKMVHEVLRNPAAVVSLQDIRTADEYTLGLSVNVAVLCVLLGNILEYSERELRDLAIGAVLHDIGKVTTPPAILSKPGGLTREEFQVMQQHAELGWSLLFEQPGIPPTSAAMARQHHERWTGGGYPDGVRGEQIFRYARICTVADCFDAMTADRVYRPGIPADLTLELMRTEMQGHFQPDLLFSFLQCVAPYPVGSMVEVTDGYQAVVVEVRRGRNSRPKIRLVRRPDGTPLPEAERTELDLHAHSEVQILRTLEQEEGGDSHLIRVV
jgi:HD-GYP domain-containing protein (c-di-GMP phosphodiesterase class II)